MGTFQITGKLNSVNKGLWIFFNQFLVTYKLQFVLIKGKWDLFSSDVAEKLNWGLALLMQLKTDVEYGRMSSFQRCIE